MFPLTKVVFVETKEQLIILPSTTWPSITFSRAEGLAWSPSRTPLGRALNASLVGAKTVNGPA